MDPPRFAFERCAPHCSVQERSKDEETRKRRKRRKEERKKEREKRKKGRKKEKKEEKKKNKKKRTGIEGRKEEATVGGRETR